MRIRASFFGSCGVKGLISQANHEENAISQSLQILKHLLMMVCIKHSTQGKIQSTSTCVAFVQLKTFHVHTALMAVL